MTLMVMIKSIYHHHGHDHENPSSTFKTWVIIINMTIIKNICHYNHGDGDEHLLK